MEAETVGDTLGDVEAEALVVTLADTLAKLEAKTLGDIKAETLVQALADTLPKKGARDTWRHTGRSGGRGTC